MKSPVHLKYLQNMGVQSTMSVSLDYDDHLWGLICCHSYGPTGKEVPFPARELCYWLGLSASSCLEKLLHTERLQARQYDHEHTFQLEFGSKTWLSTSSAEVLRLFRADFGFLVIQGEARTIGNLSSYMEAVTLLKYVYFRNFRNVFASNNITNDFKDLIYAPGFIHIAGILCIPLSQTAGDFVILFRANQEKEVHWASNPNLSKEGRNGQLEPRNSFNKWTERVRGTCFPWTEAQFEAASLTRLVYGNFIRVWREKEAVLHATKMKRLLIENLAHEFHTPLNIAINYLEMAIEKSPNKNHTDMLSVAHSASTSLVYVSK